MAWTSGSHSRSATTRSTSSPTRHGSARRAAPISRKASGRCRWSPPQSAPRRLTPTVDPAGPADRDRIQTLLKRPALEPDEIEEIRRLVVKHAGVEYALDRAHQYAQSAKAALRPFPDSEDKETLVLVADFVVDRDR